MSLICPLQGRPQNSSAPLERQARRFGLRDWISLQGRQRLAQLFCFGIEKRLKHFRLSQHLRMPNMPETLFKYLWRPRNRSETLRAFSSCTSPTEACNADTERAKFLSS